LSAKDAPSLLLRCADDSTLASRLAGAIIIDATDASERPAAESPAVRTPQPEWAESSAAAAHAWNPAGTGLAARRLPFPVLLAAPGDGAAALRAAAAHNDRRGFTAPPLYHARLDHGMIATGDAAACLEASTCLPLGGYSAFATAPLPVPPPGAVPPRLLLVTAALDSAAFFHERAVGADASLSGLVVMLAAADAMTRLPPLPAAPARRVAFAALAGEPWGHIGTRMLLAQLAGGARPAGVGGDEAGGADLIELAALGCDVAPGAPVQLYAHAAGNAGAPMVAALVAAAGASGGAVRVAPASEEAPGLPPSGLRAARRRDAAIGGVVLSDYDASYGSGFVGSRFDDVPATPAALAAAADVIAAALHALAAGGARPPQPPAGGRAATLRRVEALMVRSGLPKPHIVRSRVADASRCAGVSDAGAAQ
jgi:nicastrin